LHNAPNPLQAVKKAVYHQAAGNSKELYVVAENDNGTVDLGLENDSAIVTGCRVTEGVEIGVCTIISQEKPKKKAAKKKQTKKSKSN